MLIEALERKVNGILHMAGATRLSRYEFAEHVAKTFDLDPKHIKPVQSGQIKWIAKRPKDSSLDVSKAKRTLAIKPLEICEALEVMKKEKA